MDFRVFVRMCVACCQDARIQSALLLLLLYRVANCAQTAGASQQKQKQQQQQEFQLNFCQQHQLRHPACLASDVRGNTTYTYIVKWKIEAKIAKFVALSSNKTNQLLILIFGF